MDIEVSPSRKRRSDAIIPAPKRRKLLCQDGGTLSVKFNKLGESEYASNRFRRLTKVTKYRIDHNISGVADLFLLSDILDENYEKHVPEILKNAAPDGLFNVEIYTNTQKLFISNTKTKIFDRSAFLNILMTVMMSNETLLDDGVLTFTASVTKGLTGSGGNGRRTCHQKNAH